MEHLQLSESAETIFKCTVQSKHRVKNRVVKAHAKVTYIHVEIIQLFHARYKYGYSLMSYWSFIRNRPVVTTLFIKLLNTKNGKLNKKVTVCISFYVGYIKLFGFHYLLKTGTKLHFCVQTFTNVLIVHSLCACNYMYVLPQ